MTDSQGTHGTAGAAEPKPDPMEAARDAVVAAALPHVAFDGWSDKTIAYAVEDSGADPSLARLAFPRGGIDLALAWHRHCDSAMTQRLASDDLLGLRMRDRVAHAIAVRLEIMASEREAVRRAAALFALPNNVADGARAVWQTADAIWRTLGDTSRDASWYTKRATLSGVYSACLLYWLGDDSPDMARTRAFIRRRVDEVMQFENVKRAVRENPVASALLAGPRRVLDRVRAPDDSAADGLPGAWRRRP